MDQIKCKGEIKVSEYLIVSRGARRALDIAPANAPLANSLISLRAKILCIECKGKPQIICCECKSMRIFNAKRHKAFMIK
jgi:hypothetical protein